MNKKTLILIVIVIIFLAFWGISQWQAKVPAPLAEQPASPSLGGPALSETVVQPTEDTTAAIQKDLESVDLGDLNKEFKDADTDIAGL